MEQQWQMEYEMRRDSAGDTKLLEGAEVDEYWKRKVVGSLKRLAPDGPSSGSGSKKNEGSGKRGMEKQKNSAPSSEAKQPGEGSIGYSDL